MGDQFALVHVRGPWAPFLLKPSNAYKIVLGGKEYEHLAITKAFESGQRVLATELKVLQMEKADALNSNGLRKDNARADDEDLALRESDIDDAFLDDLF